MTVVLSLIALSVFCLYTDGGGARNRAFAQTSDLDDGTSVFPPLRASTSEGTYMVELDWQPASAGIGQDTIYLVKFLDSSGAPLAPPTVINYDLSISTSGGSLVEGFYGQETEDDGIGRPLIVQFENGGPVEITVMVNSVGPSSSSDRAEIDESVSFNMTVVPEFPVSMLLLVVASITSVVIFLGRMYNRWYK